MSDANLRQICAQIQGVEQQASWSPSNKGPSPQSQIESIVSSHGTQVILRQHGTEVLGHVKRMDFRSHQIGVLYLLDAWIQSHREDDAGGSLHPAEGVKVFLDFCMSLKDGDYIGQSVNARRMLIRMCVALYNADAWSGGGIRSKRAILPLMTVLKCCCGEGKCQLITPLQPMVFDLCIKAKIYSAARSLLARPCGIIEAPNDYNTTLSDVYNYYYNGGCIYTGLKEYRNAKEMFLTCLIIPSIVLNQVAIDAYKKYTLVCLIEGGKVPELPSKVPSVVLKGISSLCDAYISLAETSTWKGNLFECVQSNEHLWREDGNSELIGILLETSQKRRMEYYGRFYSEMSLLSLCNAIDMKDTSGLELMKLAGQGGIDFQIDQFQKTVRFRDRMDSSIEIPELVELIESCASVKSELDDVAHMLECRHQSKSQPSHQQT